MSHCVCMVLTVRNRFFQQSIRNQFAVLGNLADVYRLHLNQKIKLRKSNKDDHLPQNLYTRIEESPGLEFMTCESLEKQQCAKQSELAYSATFCDVLAKSLVWQDKGQYPEHITRKADLGWTGEFQRISLDPRKLSAEKEGHRIKHLNSLIAVSLYRNNSYQLFCALWTFYLKNWIESVSRTQTTNQY